MISILGYLCPSKLVLFIAKRRGLKEPSMAKGFDFYILTWLILECVLVVFIGTASIGPALALIIGLVLTLRVHEILNIAVSILLYGRFREGDDYVVSSVRRSILINVINYIELILLFAIIYYLVPERKVNTANINS